MAIPPDPTPNVAVQVAFTSDPLNAAPVWTTVGTAEQAQVKRGGAYQQNAVQAGTATVEIDNAVPSGAAGALYTPGNAAGLQPTPDRPVQILVTPPAPYAGVTYPIHTGNADAWEARLDAAGLDYSRATLKGVDGMVTLAGITLRSTLAQEILAAGPVGYFPLGEPAGATTAGSLTSASSSAAADGPTARLGYDGVPGGAAAFGGAVLVPSDPATALAFGPGYGPPNVNGLIQANGGVPLTLPQTSAVSITGGFTASCVFAGGQPPTHTGGATLLFARYGPGDYNTNVMFQLHLTDYNELKFRVSNPAAGSTAREVSSYISWPTNFRDGKPHLVHAVLEADLITVTLYVDGVQYSGSSNTGGAIPAGSSEHIWAGYATRQQSLDGQYGPLFLDGQLGHVALYNFALTPTRVAAQYQAFLGFPGELSGARVGRILSYAQEPNDAAHRRLDRGRSVLGPLMLAGTTALSAVQTAAADEQGLFFKDGAGRSVFQDRGHRQNAVSKVTLNIGDDSLPVEPDIAFSIDRTFIRNDITGSRPNGAVQRVQDTTSQRQHRRVTEPSPLTINLPTDDQVLYALQWRLLHLAQPMVRIPQCSIKPVTSPALWPWALGLEVGDQITIANLPPTAPAPTMQVVIDAIDYGHVTADEWIVTFLLSPAEPYNYLRADGAPSTYTRLDSGLKIGW